MFHIQTEDSGVRHPHVITHLFADGGRILKTTKTSYAEFIDAPNMAEVVRQMMQDQHKSMFMALRDGQFDHLIEEVIGKGKAAAITPAAAPSPPAAVAEAPARAAMLPPKGPEQGAAAVAKAPDLERNVGGVAPPAEGARFGGFTPPAPADPRNVNAEIRNERSPEMARGFAARLNPLGSAPTQPAVPIAVSTAPPPRVNVISAPPVTTPPAPAPQSLAPQRSPTPARMASARPRLDIDPAAIHRAPMPNAGPQGGTLASVVEASVEARPGIDLGTLERAAAEAETPLFQQIRDLPPPPAAVLGARSQGTTGGGYSSVATSAPAPAPPPSARGRYAPSRPSSIFAAVRPQEGASIFGEDLISEKSLDEVILSYLAEDLDGPGDKK